MRRMNGRQRTVLLFGMAVLFLALIAILGQVLEKEAIAADFTRKDRPPCFSYLFGTDWMGRDMFVRTLTGLSMSIRIGLLAAGVKDSYCFCNHGTGGGFCGDLGN